MAAHIESIGAKLANTLNGRERHFVIRPTSRQLPKARPFLFHAGPIHCALMMSSEPTCKSVGLSCIVMTQLTRQTAEMFATGIYPSIVEGTWLSCFLIFVFDGTSPQSFVLVGNAKHYFPVAWVPHQIDSGAQFLRAIEPIFGVVKIIRHGPAIG